MLKFVILAAVIAGICRFALGKWPWDYVLGSPTKVRAVFQARKLLAVHEGATRQEITDAHRSLIAMVHPDRGGTNAKVHEANAARDLLFDELPYEN
jgi:DnaJ homolog subfamily C member 19